MQSFLDKLTPCHHLWLLFGVNRQDQTLLSLLSHQVLPECCISDIDADWMSGPCPQLSPNDACVCACSVTKLYLTLCDPWTVAHQAPLSMGFFRQESWSGLPFPPPEGLPRD